MVRFIFAKILYWLFNSRIELASKKQDAILSIYGHDQKQEPFEKLVVWLLDHNYEFITPALLYDIVVGTRPIDKKYVWLSFDDGWKSSFDNIFPVMKKYDIPATFFIASKGIIDGYYWFSRAFQNRDSKLYNAVDELWSMPNTKRKEIIEQLNPYHGGRVTMNEFELMQMNESGLAYFGNHTHDHVINDMCDKEDLAIEIEKCSQIMKNIIDDSCSFIYSYPNGNMDNNTVDVISEKGFKLAATVKMGWIKPGDNPYALCRNEFKNGCIEENILQIYGLWTPFFNRIKRFLHIKNHK